MKARQLCRKCAVLHRPQERLCSLLLKCEWGVKTISKEQGNRRGIGNSSKRRGPVSPAPSQVLWIYCRAGGKALRVEDQVPCSEEEEGRRAWLGPGLWPRPAQGPKTGESLWVLDTRPDHTEPEEAGFRGWGQLYPAVRKFTLSHFAVPRYQP